MKRAGTRSRKRCSRSPRPCIIRHGSLGTEVRCAQHLDGRGQYTPPDRPQYFPSSIPDASYVRVFDTTLRDGEQSPGAALTAKEKLAVARNLARLRVDVLEAGFPRASADDLAAVKQVCSKALISADPDWSFAHSLITLSVAESVGREVADDGYVPAICGLSRASQSDVEAAWNAVSNAICPRIHTFIATSKVHMESKLKKTPQQVIEYATNAVRHARSLGCEDVEFSAEDSGRSEPEFLREILAAVIDAGATTLNIPDTVGWCLPHEFGNLIETLRSDVAGSESVLWSVHCQNDLGLATANSIAGALGGARQIECTINGIGERAGNASLEEVALSLLLRGHSSAGNGLWCGIEPKHIASTSSMVSEFTGMSVQPHKAIVGANAFAHESGIHQDGMLKNRSTYEIVDPAVVGITRRSSDPGLVLGKHSGRHAVRSKLDELGYELSEDEVDGVFERFKDVAQHRSGGISDEDISALVHDSVYQPSAVWELVELTVTCGTMSLPVACVQLKGPDGLHRCATASGTGPVDAAYKAVDEVVRTTAQLTEYNISAVTEGIEALATTRVTIRPMDDTTRYSASGSSADVVRASVRAYVSALNKLITRTASEAARSDEGVSASNDNVSNSENSSNFAAATASTNNRQRE